MKMALRARICSQCCPAVGVADLLQPHGPHPCEANCTLFVQLPRLARFLERHFAKPPPGYEEFVLKLLEESTADIPNGSSSTATGPFMDYALEALVILERIVALSQAPVLTAPHHDCARQSFALGQIGVHASRCDSVEHTHIQEPRDVE
jgi:hypothetical protein